MSWLSKGNIHTQWIEEALGVTNSVAKRVHEQIDNNYTDFRWSEATLGEIKLVSLMAFEDLNETVPADFYM